MDRDTTIRWMVRRFLPPQHGAWAMLAVPFLAGLWIVGASWPALPLAGAWLTGYLFSYYLFQAIKTRRLRRWRSQLTLYGTLTAPLLLLVVWAEPAVLRYAPVFAALWSINAWYAWRRRERALVNDLVAVAQTGLIMLVLATLTGHDPATVVAPAVACVAYFAGTALYVKTMIRHRHDRRYLRWSIGYHAVLLVVAGLLIPQLGPLPAGLAAWLLLRSWLLPRRGLRPLLVGVLEICHSLALLLVIGLSWAAGA